MKVVFVEYRDLNDSKWCGEVQLPTSTPNSDSFKENPSKKVLGWMAVLHHDLSKGSFETSKLGLNANYPNVMTNGYE